MSTARSAPKGASKTPNSITPTPAKAPTDTVQAPAAAGTQVPQAANDHVGTSVRIVLHRADPEQKSRMLHTSMHEYMPCGEWYERFEIVWRGWMV